VSNDVGIYIGMGIVFMYAVFGGMKGITYTQVAQYCVLITAYTIPAVFISLQLTGNPIPAAGPGLDLAGTDISLLDKLDQVVTDLGFASTPPPLAGSTLNMFVYHHRADDRHGGPAARHHPLLHRAEGGRRTLLGRLGAGVHRHPLHDRPGRGRWPR
jgi:Na+(H+)/acetate symporter ActP